MTDVGRSFGDDAPAPDDVEPDHERKAKRRQRVQLAIAVGLLVLVFGVILPQFIDYDAVWEVTTSLSTTEFVVLLALGLVRIPIVAAQYSSVIPGLTVRESVRSYLAANSVAEFTPPPTDLVVRYGMYRAQGIEAEAASTGILLTGLFDNAVKLAVPVLALIALLLTGVDDQAVWELALLGIAALVGGALLVAFAIRSEVFARKLGEWLGRLISWFLVRFNRNPLEDLGPKAVSLRTRVGGTLRARWPVATVATVAGQAMNFVILLVALRFVGVTNEQVDWVDLLVAFALVLILTALPLTPGGIGVAAVGYTAILGDGDPVLSNLIGSASLLTRVFTWLLPVLIGLIPLLRWRRSQRRSASDPSAGEHAAAD